MKMTIIFTEERYTHLIMYSVLPYIFSQRKEQHYSDSLTYGLNAELAKRFPSVLPRRIHEAIHYVYGRVLAPAYSYTAKWMNTMGIAIAPDARSDAYGFILVTPPYYKVDIESFSHGAFVTVGINKPTMDDVIPNAEMLNATLDLDQAGDKVLNHITEFLEGIVNSYDDLV